MLIPLLFQEFFIFFFTFFIQKNNLNKNVVTIFFIFVTFIIGITRNFSVSPDYPGYVLYFYQYKNVVVEPSYKFFSFILKDCLHFGIEWIFYIYFILSFFIKIFVIEKCSDNVNLSILTYVSYILLIQEFIQIRAGLCASFVLLAFYYLTRNKKLGFFVSCILATLSHMSGIFSFFLIFLYKKKSEKEHIWIWCVLVLVSFICVFLHFGPVKLLLMIPIPYLRTKVSTYYEFSKMSGTSINPFNIQNLFRCLILALIFKYRKIALKTSSDYFLFKTFSLTIFTFLFFSDVMTLGSRLSQLFKVFDILFMPVFFRIFKEKWLGKIFILLFLLLQFISMFSNGYIPF